MINVVLIVHGCGNLICILSDSGDYFPPASRLGVRRGEFRYNLRIHLNVPLKEGNPGDTIC